MIPNHKKFILSIIIFVLLSSTSFSQEKGYLKFDVNVDSISIIVDNNFEEVKTISSEDSLFIGIGSRLINISTPFDTYYEKYVRILAKGTTIIKHSFDKNLAPILAIKKNNAAKKYYAADVMIVTDFDTEIFYEDSLIGIGFAKAETGIGISRFQLKNPDFGTSDFEIERSNTAFILPRKLYRRPHRSSARVLSFFPGASQFYKKQYGRSSILFTATTALIVMGANAHNTYQKELSIFNGLVSNYNKSTDEQRAFELGNLVDSQHEKVKKADNSRRIFIGAIISTYAFNIIDAFLKEPTGGYRKEKSLDFYLTRESGLIGNSTKATFSYHF